MAPDGSEVARRPKGRVLIVDDEPDVLESTALLVESLGYEALRLADAGLIQDVVAHEEPDLLLQDLHMADLNVSGLVAALRSDPRTTELPIVFFSASRELAATAVRYDAYGHLSKPFTRAEMANLLARALGPPEGRFPMGRSMKRELRGAFHDMWDLIAALNNYIQLLEARGGHDEAETRYLRGLDETLLKLEGKTDRLRSYVMTVVDALEPVPQEGRGGSTRDTVVPRRPR